MCVCVEPVKLLSRVQLYAIFWTVANQAPPSMEFSRQEYWSELSFPSAGDLPDPGIKPRSPALWVDSLLSEPPVKTKGYIYTGSKIIKKMVKIKSRKVVFWDEIGKGHCGS